MRKFEQMKSLFNTMSRVYKKSSDSEMYVSGLTADFDRLFELGWKTVKEYLKSEGFSSAKSGSPKQILKLAYQQELIKNEEIWLEMLDDRNDDTHLYNESAARSYAARIERDYLPVIDAFITDLKAVIPDDEDCLVKVPESFLEARKISGLLYDEFLRKVKQENGFISDTEVFTGWDAIKDKYLSGSE
ncbi:MAG: HI0074 family nucleotidyltransferase substrate-binding subunit [Lachnospiraceae bacterium]|nr:HI0074 family nucleotidyltransferase substrate-binding subunit [Lachnospiraceae bacterium]